MQAQGGGGACCNSGRHHTARAQHSTVRHGRPGPPQTPPVPDRMSVDSTAWPRYVCTARQLGCCTTRPLPGYSIQRCGREGIELLLMMVAKSSARAPCRGAPSSAATRERRLRRQRGGAAHIVPVEGRRGAVQAVRILLACHHAAVAVAGRGGECLCVRARRVCVRCTGWGGGWGWGWWGYCRPPCC